MILLFTENNASKRRNSLITKYRVLVVLLAWVICVSADFLVINPWGKSYDCHIERQEKMGKSKKNKNSEAIKVSKRIRVNVSLYKHRAYCHLTDSVKDKSVSLNMESIKKLGKALPKIVKSMGNLESKENDSSSSSASDSD